jgi:hypothetical protein
LATSFGQKPATTLSWKIAYGKSGHRAFYESLLIMNRAYTISNHWPRAGVTVTAIKGMYNKMLNQEKSAAGAAQTNGGQNGA